MLLLYLYILEISAGLIYSGFDQKALPDSDETACH